ncbi:MAG: hypothetical protein MI723_05155 [Caulobacterales bacterium]|nr:hypothetical protein [Caulobacterales bacterium]
MSDEVNEQSHRYTELRQDIIESLQAGLEGELQKEVGNVAVLIADVEELDAPELLAQIDLAMAALKSTPPNIAIARKVTRKVRSRVWARRNILNPVNWVAQKRHPSVTVVIGLAILFYFAIPVVAILATWITSNHEKFFGVPLENVGTAVFFGALGSIVSILVRLKDFAELDDVEPFILFFTGLFKPVIGASFSLFVFVALSSGLIPVTIQGDDTVFAFAAFSFVAGFSERFARDVASRTEGALGGSNQAA